MISRSAQLKGQDQKVTYLTDDFTMKDFIAVSQPPKLLLGCPLSGAEGLISVRLGTQNPKFMQGTAYEPLTLNIPLLETLVGATSRNIGPSAADEIGSVDGDEKPFDERREPAAEEQLTPKKRRTIRFLD